MLQKFLPTPHPATLISFSGVRCHLVPLLPLFFLYMTGFRYTAFRSTLLRNPKKKKIGVIH